MIGKILSKLFVTSILLAATLFIKQQVEMPSRLVKLGYPLHFYTLDFSGIRGSTTLSGSPDSYLQENRFNITSSWEEFGEVNWFYLILSYALIFISVTLIQIIISKISFHIVN